MRTFQRPPLLQTLLTMRRVLTLSRLVGQTGQTNRPGLTASWARRDLSTGPVVQGTLTMPDRLQHIPEAEVSKSINLLFLQFS